jgi:hypothetical protein
MADSPSRLLPRRASSSAQPQAPGRRLPVWLYLPNLLGYLRIALSVYGLSIVAGTVRRRGRSVQSINAAGSALLSPPC